VKVLELCVVLVIFFVFIAQFVQLILYHELQVIASFVSDKVIVVQSAHKVNFVVSMLVQFVIFNTFEILVCDVQYVNVKPVKAKVLELCVALVTFFVFTVQFVQLTLYHQLHVIVSFVSDKVTVVQSVHRVNFVVSVLVQFVIFKAFEVLVCGELYANVKPVNVKVLELCVVLVIAFVFALQSADE
jgi:hypothetical protein